MLVYRVRISSLHLLIFRPISCGLFRAAKVRQLNGGDKPEQSYFEGFINVFTFIIINKKSLFHQYQLSNFR